MWTDYKPLISIYKKPLASAPKRLQRSLLRLQQYDVDLRYKPGSEMYLADTLSRAFLKNSIQSKAEEEAETIHAEENHHQWMAIREEGSSHKVSTRIS